MGGLNDYTSTSNNEKEGRADTVAVQVWIGEKPEHPNERRAIVALANGLDRMDGLYLVLSNFHVGGRTIDMTIIKHDAIFIIELKNCNGKIIGGVNGPWYMENTNGERKRINPGRSNPYNQAISYYYSLTNFLNNHRSEFLSEHKAQQINFRTCRRLVVIAPKIPESSEIDLDWKVEIKGLDELPSYLVTEISTEIELTDEEMLAIPKMLGCTHWNDINQLIAGIFPGWHFEKPVSGEGEAIACEPGDAPQDQPARSLPACLPLFRRVRAALGTTAWRVTLAMTVLAIVLLVALVTRHPMPPAHPEQPRVSLVSSTIGPAGGVYGNEFYSGSITHDSGCVWSGFQPIGKQWDDTGQQWVSVGVDGTAAEHSPDVVVTLEQVNYCGEQITLTWSIRNHRMQEAVFPLQNRNITIRDPLGNRYLLADSKSQPAILRVGPGEQKRGTAIVSHPVIPNVPSLLVRLKEQPFGESSWLVSLEEN